MAGLFVKTEDLQGFQSSLRTIGKARAATGKTIEAVLKRYAEVILKKSQEYVPVSEYGTNGAPPGALKESGHVETEGQGLSARARVVYSKPYAVFVHEETSHAHEPPTCAKYLERAARETRGAGANIVKREVEISRSAF